MTIAVERPVPPSQTEGTRGAAGAHGPRGSWSRRRLELRLAARQARRSWVTSVLVIALIAMPMIGISGAAVFLSSRLPATEEQITAQLGDAQAWLKVVGGADPTRTQETTADAAWDLVEVDDDGMPVHPPSAPPADLRGLVPETELLVVAQEQVAAQTPGGEGVLTGFAGNAADPRLDGRFELIDGRRPMRDREALVSPGALARLGAQIGDDLVLTDPAATLTIVGVMKEARATDSEQAVFIPASVDIETDPLETVWFAPDWQPRAEDLPALNRAGVVAYPRDLIAEMPEPTPDSAATWSITVVVLIVGGFVAYLVVLLAGAGFAVSARRQQRSLAVAASVGAERGTVFRIVLLQGTVLGACGGVLGAAIGIGLAAPVLQLFDDGAVSSFWGFHVPWWGIGGVVLFAALVGTASALAPARAATRGDVLASLRGSRKPAVVRVSRPFWGTLLGVVGLALTAVGGVGLAALNTAEPIDYGHPLRAPLVVCIVAGPLLFQIGAIVAGHWLLTQISRGVSRLGLAPRLAARDAAANPSRIVPAFAAIAACVFLASFALTATALYTGTAARNWWYQAPKDSVYVTIWAEPEADAIVDVAVEALEQTGPDSLGIVRDAVGRYTSGPEDLPATAVLPEAIRFDDCATTIGVCMSRASALFSTSSPIVVAADDLDEVLGVEVSDDVRERFADGGALALDAAYLDDGAVVLNRWDRDDLEYGSWNENQPLPTALDTARIPAQQVSAPHPLPWPVILSPAAADAFGYETVVSMAIASFTSPPSPQTLDRLAVIAGQPWTDSGGFSYGVENGPPPTAPWLWLILGTAGVLVLGAASVALGLARIERRPDDATLSAIGGSPRVRRGIAFWQALILVGVGSVVGTVAGLIPMWGIVMQSGSSEPYTLTMADAPWPWLALLALGLPLAIAVASWLIPVRRPDLSRRTVIA